MVAPAIGPVLLRPPTCKSQPPKNVEAAPALTPAEAESVLPTVSPSASTENPVIVIVPIVRSPEPSTLVAPAIGPVLLRPPTCKSQPPKNVEAAPALTPAEAESVLPTVSPSASTVKPDIVIVPIVRSPEPSTLVAPAIAPALVIPPLLLFRLAATAAPSLLTLKTP